MTAIRGGGGNPELVAEPGWTPLGVTPNHPEYPAGHGCATGVVSSSIAQYFGTHKGRLVVDSRAFSDGIHTHTFEDTRDLFREVLGARICAGFHYRHSVQDGGVVGRRVSQRLFRRLFRLQGNDDDDDDDDEDGHDRSER